MIAKIKNMINGNGKPKKKKKTANNISGCTVEPLRKIEDVHSIERLLEQRGNYRDLLMWVLGCNCGLRAVDILALKVKDLLDKPVNTKVDVHESKTDKSNFMVINKKVLKTFKAYMAHYGPSPDDYLFKSTRGGSHLTSGAVGKKIRSWCKAIGLEQERYGTHTMRKTFGYIKRVHEGVGIEILQERYNHGSPRVTLRYLCITRGEVAEIMEKPI